MTPPVGVVDVVYATATTDAGERSRLARDDGFAHIDCMVDDDPATLALPVGCPTAFPKPRAQWCATPAPARDVISWEKAVAWWRAAPGALCEPWKGAVVHDAETIAEFARAVPGVRFLIDTGHVADWGGDPVELMEWADHVQLRQGAPGETQLHVDDGRGVVDFRAVLARLDALGYTGKLSVEHFDLPAQGWPCADPRGWARDLKAAL